MSDRPFQLIGELMNHSFARARRAWESRDLASYQKLAKLQSDLHADYLTLNLDGTQTLQVKQQEMLDFLPELIPAIQEVTSLPIAFDNPALVYHKIALENYDQTKSPRPIFNSLAASRDNLDEMIELIEAYDTKVIIMASEKFKNGSSAQCTSGDDVYRSTKHFTELLVDKAKRKIDDIIVDPGLAPIGADTYGLVNMGLDAMRLIRQDPDLEGIHISVGLTNFSFGTPKSIRVPMENAYITLAKDAGLDFVLGNPEKDLTFLDAQDNVLQVITSALETGRPINGESQEDAGFRQAEKIMDLF